MDFVGKTSTSRVSPTGLQPGKEGAAQGRFQTRTVTRNHNPVPSVGTGTHGANHPVPSPIATRAIAQGGPQGSTESSVNQSPAAQVETVENLTNYLTDQVEQGNTPDHLQADFETAIAYAGSVDEDIGRAAVLLGKLDEGGGAGAHEQVEAQALLAAGKHNLALIQGWLMSKEDQLSASGGMSRETGRLIQDLQARFADRHMDVADLMSLYDLDEMPQEAVSRSDRVHTNLLSAATAANAARQLSVPGLSDSAKSEIVKALEEHHDALSHAKTLSEHPGLPAQPPTDKLALPAKELWSNPFTLVKEKKGDKDAIGELKAHWDQKMQGGKSDEPWLPLAHGKVGQTRMLQEFVKHRVQAAGVEKRHLPDLKFLFQQARNQTFNQQSWDPIEKEVRYRVPVASGGQAAEEKTVQSTISPAKAFDENFVQKYRSDGIDGVNCSDRLQYQHAPNLAHTQAKDETGKVLFAGLRHGVLDSYDLHGKNLNKLPDATLRSMISDLLVRNGAVPVPQGVRREAVVDDIFTAIRSSPASAKDYANKMRAEASKNMAREVAVTALVSDPEKFQKALAGETVPLNLSSISLLTPDHTRPLFKGPSSDEKNMLKVQTAALHGLAKDTPATLEVRDENGNIQPVQVKINVRPFNFGVNGGAIGQVAKISSTTPVWRNLMGWGFSMERNNPELTTLIGSSNGRGLGGDVQRKLDQMQAQKEQLQVQASDGSGDRIEVERQITRVDKDIAKLSSAASQLKDIWREGSFISGDQEPYKMVSRLALVTYLMGETPLFNCKSGKDRTGQLDAEVKCLAAFAEQNGTLNIPDQKAEEMRHMRSQFTLGSGNLEMQRLNTGLPGYKLKWSQVPGLANMVADGALESAYRGGSDYVAA